MSAECGQTVVESVTPVCSAPETAQTALPLNLNLQLYLTDLTLLLLPSSGLTAVLEPAHPIRDGPK